MTQDSRLMEVCSGSLVSALNAQAGGAHRVELCDNLSEGGTTPSAATIMLTKKKLSIPVFVLIRPRAGDFLYSDVEYEAMKEDIFFCKKQGVEGVVLGILKDNGHVDLARTSVLVELARPMQVTFHRAFDVTADPFQALEDIIGLGIERILTSGQAASALAGSSFIQQLNNRTRNRIIIMPGGGITEKNVKELLDKTGATEIHASLRSPVRSRMKFRNQNAFMGQSEQNNYEWMETDPARVDKVMSSLRECH